MTNRFLDLLAEKPFLMADGATGTNLFAMGLSAGEAPELWNLAHPERILALHRHFLEAGADVILTDMGDAASGAAAALADKGYSVEAAALDVTERPGVDALAAKVEGDGGLDILVNNAGIGDFGKRLHEADDATWAKVLDINLTGVFRMTRAAIPELIKAGGGSIVNISTVASLIGIRGLSAYAASKGGLDALTRSLAVDYASDNIRCNAVNPGLVDTPMAAPLMADPASLEPIMSQYAIRRPGKPEEVAKMVLYLASDESSWVTGGTFPIDGGMTISKG